jgi:hypothetical protein
VVAASPADFGKLIADDEKWAKVIGAANIEPEPAISHKRCSAKPALPAFRRFRVLLVCNLCSGNNPMLFF